MAALVWYAVSAICLISNAAEGLFSPDYDGDESSARLQKAVYKQSWMFTITLGVNVSDNLP